MKAKATDYKVLAASLDLNDAVTKLVEDNDTNVAALLRALAKYTDAVEAETAPPVSNVGGDNG